MSPFKAYDIRGVYGRDFDADTVYRIGRELPALLDTRLVLVGRDDRASSPEIFDALTRGITDAGADVDNMGLCTTPMTYYFTGLKHYAAAVMITASHNPREYNGLKVSRAGALPVGYDSGLSELERRISGESQSGTAASPVAPARGRVRDVDYTPEYVDFLKQNLPDRAGLRVCIDCSNGMAALLARDVFGDSATAADSATAYMYDTIDGTFPNHSPNPLEPAATRELSAKVISGNFDIGVIFDGDADRVMFVDERGTFVRPDIIIAILADYYLKREPGANILCDIRTSRGVTDAITRAGGTPYLWKVGHAFAKVRLRELNGIVGGELAGHYYFRDFFGCDSAMLCAEIVLGVVAESAARGVPFSQLIAQIDVYANTGECNYTIAKKDDAMAALRAWAESGETPDTVLDFDGLRFEWPDRWFNVRPSNTEPYLRIVAEARTPALLADMKAHIDRILSDYTDS